MSEMIDTRDERRLEPEQPLGEEPATPTEADEDTLVFEALEGKIIDTLKSVYDPEIPVDIYELGLIYKIEIRPDMSVDIAMTLTSPACPAAGSLPPEVEFKVASIPEITDVRVEIVWDPPWTPDFMSEAAKLELNMW
jgi:FeS assembly SUF system protein